MLKFIAINQKIIKKENLEKIYQIALLQMEFDADSNTSSSSRLKQSISDLIAEVQKDTEIQIEIIEELIRESIEQIKAGEPFLDELQRYILLIAGYKVEPEVIEDIYKSKDYFAAKSDKWFESEISNCLFKDDFRDVHSDLIVKFGTIPQWALMRFDEYLKRKIYSFQVERCKRCMAGRITDEIYFFLRTSDLDPLPPNQVRSIKDFVLAFGEYFYNKNFEIILFSNHRQSQNTKWTNVELAIASSEFTNQSCAERAKHWKTFLPQDNPWFNVIGISEEEYRKKENPLLVKIKEGIKVAYWPKSLRRCSDCPFI